VKQRYILSDSTEGGQHRFDTVAYAQTGPTRATLDRGRSLVSAVALFTILTLV